MTAICHVTKNYFTTVKLPQTAWKLPAALRGCIDAEVLHGSLMTVNYSSSDDTAERDDKTSSSKLDFWQVDWC